MAASPARAIRQGRLGPRKWSGDQPLLLVYHASVQGYTRRSDCAKLGKSGRRGLSRSNVLGLANLAVTGRIVIAFLAELWSCFCQRASLPLAPDGFNPTHVIRHSQIAIPAQPAHLGPSSGQEGTTDEH